jgi:hypothetical protein
MDLTIFPSPAEQAMMKLGLHAKWSPQSPKLYPSLGDLNAPLNAWSRLVSVQRLNGFNSDIGDCVPTGCINGVLDWLGARGIIPPLVPNQLAKDLYKAVGDYVDGDPSTDNGVDPDRMWAWWMQNAILGCKLKEPPILIDPRNEWAVRKAIQNHGFIGTIASLALEQQNEIIWTALGTPGTWGLHYLNIDGFDGPYTATSWGYEKQIDQSYFDSGFIKQVYEFTLIQ